MSDLYRQLVLGNYAPMDGQAGEPTLGALNRLYPDQGTLPGFELKSGAYNAAGLIVYNLLQHPEQDAIGYRILATVLKRLLDAEVLDALHLGDRVDHLKPFACAEEVPAAPLVEGTLRQIQVNAYERSGEARRKCIEYHGTQCAVCEFDFARVYGSAMDGYIHVHHLRPLAEIGTAYVVDPRRGLLPVCPNCHGASDSLSPDRALVIDRWKFLGFAYDVDPGQ